MPRCYNCNQEVRSLIKSSPCSTPSCRNIIKMGEGSSDNYYCSTHQQEFPQKIKNLEGQIAEMERIIRIRGQFSSPSEENQELRKENQELRANLSLQISEWADLQAQIRALNSQLSERENNTPWQARITKLEEKLELVKRKLVDWNQLLTK